MLKQDVRYAFRTLAKNPGFAAVAVVSLALGIGANTTIFTLINAVFLNPLPVESPSELLAVVTVDENNPGASTVSYPNYRDFRDENTVFDALAAYSFPNLVSMFAGGDQPEQIFVEFVTGNYFDVLGIQPTVGRFFAPEEDQTPGSHPVAVLGHGLWTRRFGADDGVIGSTITLNGSQFTVIGVGPEHFRGITVIFGPDLWVPTMMQEQLAAAQFREFFDNRRALFFNVFGRLKSGVAPEQAYANMETIAGALAQEYPEPNKGRSAQTIPLTEATIFPGFRDNLVLGGAMLMVIVGLVLLIACSNVANLMLARATSRQKEIAVRLAMGAGRFRLIRQLLTESVLISVLGGAIGLVVAIVGRDFIWSFRPQFIANNTIDLVLDSNVFIFTAVISLLTSLLFGLVPSLQASRFNVVATLKEETRTAGRSHGRFSLRNGLVVAQVALSIVSLVAAGLFVRSLSSAHELDPGFETERLGVMMISPGQAGYDQARTEQYYDLVRERVAALPGVQSVSWASNLPLFGGFTRSVFPESREGEEEDEGILVTANTIDLGYLDTFDVSLLRGRDFTAADRQGSVPVAIVNDTMAEQFWPGEEAIGKRFRLFGHDYHQEIVGIVETTKIATLGEDPQPCLYLPLDQNYSDIMALYLRTEAEPAAVMTVAQREIGAIDNLVPIITPLTVSEVIDQSLFAPKLAAGLLGVMGLIALALASIGLYGVLAFSVSQRRQEIGLRMALGAGQPDVLRLVLSNAMMLVGIGLVLGLGAAYAVSRAVTNLLYGITATDPITFVAVTTILVVVALVASGVPAFRASRVDPLTALRYQ